MADPIAAQDWFPGLNTGALTLGAAYASLARIGLAAREVPLMVQLVENPRYRIPGVELFHGAADLETHDCIHIVLGRGLEPMDEAFVLGFTMGSTKEVSSVEEALYGFISRYIYPSGYSFSAENLAVYRDALRLGTISGCVSLADINYRDHFARSITEVRALLGVEPDLLTAYYRIEKRRYPAVRESQRLVAD